MYEIASLHLTHLSSLKDTVIKSASAEMCTGVSSNLIPVHHTRVCITNDFQGILVSYLIISPETSFSKMKN